MTSTRAWQHRRRALVTLTAALTLAACAGTGSSGGMGGGGMGGGGMAGGGMGGRGMGGDSVVAGDDHDEGNAAGAIAGAREVAVEAGDLYFTPDAIRIEAGEPVNITVDNVGNVFHDFTLTSLDVMIDVPAGETATGGLTVTEPGEYAFECTVPGHAAGGMTGTLIVE